MGDKPESETNLTTFFSKLIAPISGFISLAITLLSVVNLLNEPKNAGNLTIILIGLGILGLIGVCLYYARFWQPEKADQGIPLFIPNPTGRQVKQQQRNLKQRQFIRRSAVAGLITIPLLTLSGLGYWQHLQNQSSKDILILVSDFQSTVDQKYQVTQKIINQLEKEMYSLTDVKITHLRQVLTTRQEARQQKANIVIWGSYGETKDIIPVIANIELIDRADKTSKLLPEAKGIESRLPVADLDSGELRTQLSKGMTYLTFFVLGVLHYEKQNWDKSYFFLNRALKEVKDIKLNLDHDIVYFFRGRALYNLKKYKEAIDDFEKVSSNPEYDEKSTNNICTSYISLASLAREEKDEKAESEFAKQADNSCQKAVKLEPDWAFPHYNLGTVYYAQENYEAAISSFRNAVGLAKKSNDKLYDSAYLRLGLSHLENREAAKAKEIFEELRKKTKNKAVKESAEKELERLRSENQNI